MVTKLQDANIVIEIDEGRAKAELERFRQLLGQQGATFDREREGEQKKEEGKTKKEMQKQKKGAIKSLSAIGQGITGAIKNIQRAAIEAPLSLGLGMILPGDWSPMIRGAVQAASVAAEFGAPVAGGLMEGLIPEGTPGRDAAISFMKEEMKTLSSQVVKNRAAIQAIGQTTDQVSKIGVSMMAGGMGQMMLNPEFASRMTLGIYDYNKAQIGARREAYLKGIEYFSKDVGSILGNVFNQ